jgi:hypothetical protein
MFLGAYDEALVLPVSDWSAMRQSHRRLVRGLFS